MRRRASRGAYPVPAIAGAAVLLLAAAGCEPVNEVRLTFESAWGWSCRSDAEPDHTLLSRATDDAGTISFGIVVDLIDYGGPPSCGTGLMLDWCAFDGNACTVVDRECREDFVMRPGDPLCPIDAGGEAPDHTPEERVLCALNRLRPGRPTIGGDAVFPDAPDQQLIVRVVLVQAGSCGALERRDGSYPTIGPETLVGCVHSCPVRLDHVSGPLPLDLATYGYRCQEAVETCARWGRLE